MILCLLLLRVRSPLSLFTLTLTLIPNCTPLSTSYPCPEQVDDTVVPPVYANDNHGDDSNDNFLRPRHAHTSAPARTESVLSSKRIKKVVAAMAMAMSSGRRDQTGSSVVAAAAAAAGSSSNTHYNHNQNDNNKSGHASPNGRAVAAIKAAHHALTLPAAVFRQKVERPAKRQAKWDWGYKGERSWHSVPTLAAGKLDDDVLMMTGGSCSFSSTSASSSSSPGEYCPYNSDVWDDEDDDDDTSFGIGESSNRVNNNNNGTAIFIDNNSGRPAATHIRNRMNTNMNSRS